MVELESGQVIRIYQEARTQYLLVPPNAPARKLELQGVVDVLEGMAMRSGISQEQLQDADTKAAFNAYSRPLDELRRAKKVTAEFVEELLRTWRIAPDSH